MPRDAVSRSVNVGTVGKNGSRDIPTDIESPRRGRFIARRLLKSLQVALYFLVQTWKIALVLQYLQIYLIRYTTEKRLKHGKLSTFWCLMGKSGKFLWILAIICWLHAIYHLFAAIRHPWICPFIDPILTLNSKPKWYIFVWVCDCLVFGFLRW